MTDKYQCGDIVTVKATVTSDRTMINGTVMCSFYTPMAKHTNMIISINENDIVTHTPKPRPIQVGDVVKYSNGFNCSKYNVLCIEGDYAWIKHNSDPNVRYSVTLSELERV